MENKVISEILEDIDLVLSRKEILSSIAKDVILKYSPKIWEEARKDLGWKDSTVKPNKGEIVCMLLSTLGPTLGFWNEENWVTCDSRQIVHPEYWISLP